MLKGSMANVVILVALLFTLVVLFYDVTPFWYEGQKDEAILHRDLYMMNNSLLAARSYMDTSLSYSVYQACYDTLKNLDTSAGDDVFRSDLEDSIKSYLNRYRKDEYYFMSNYPVTIPEYTDLTIETLDPLKVKVESPSNMYISLEHEGSERRLETKNTMEKTITIDCYGIYKKGKEVHTEINNVIGDKIKEKIDSWPDTSDALPKLNELENQVKTIPELAFEKTEGDYSIKSEFSEAKVEFEGYEKSGSEPYKNIKYKVTVKLGVSVTRHDQVFPIYNGSKIVFSPLTMVFLFEESYSG